MLNPKPFASLAEIFGVTLFSTIFSNTGHGARSAIIRRASSTDRRPSGKAASAPASRAARSRASASSYPCFWMESSILDIKSNLERNARRESIVYTWSKDETTRFYPLA
ncbi:hypothetical protein HZS61_000877 [Fusarium oxysporum f. sp. conglutinans]|uniref:Uncharacterized protein n=1 Tax=Fusarium oxysporum f. sp. conglutinans TaxID=100902 RepID=A0A8H6LSU9_FUSOX|nr:hypothetical protein HZS61_000877 [Fusarium oxysporum f. sp. conglutinans]